MKRDWEERTAKRVLSNDKLTLGFGSNSVEDIAALAKLLRRAGDRCTPRKARSTAMKKGPQRDWAERPKRGWELHSDLFEVFWKRGPGGMYADRVRIDGVTFFYISGKKKVSAARERDRSGQ